MNILALDLGTTTGWAMISRGERTSGAESFSPRRSDGPGQRWLKFRRFLSDKTADADLSAIYFEIVMRHGPGVDAAHAYGGFKAILEMFAALQNLPLQGVGVGVIKKHWTGKGNAKKPDMIAECVRRGLKPKDDNESDALALLDYARCDQGQHTPTALEQFTPPGGNPVVTAVLGGWIDPFLT